MKPAMRAVGALVVLWSLALLARPEIASTPNTRAVANQPYRYNDAGRPSIRDDDGGLFFFRLDQRPEGMRIDNLTGEFFWLPTDAGRYPVTLVPADVLGDGVPQVFDITVESGAPPSWQPPAGIVVTAGTPAVLQLKADAGTPPLVWRLESAPPGSLLQPERGALAFFPGDAGTLAFEVSLSNEFGRDTHAFTVTADPAPQAPPRARLEARPDDVSPGADVVLDATASTSGTALSGLLDYTFDPGDGTPSIVQSAPDVTVFYAQPGVYRASVTVENVHLLTDRATKAVVVRTDGGAAPPSATIVARRRSEGFGPSVVDFECDCQPGDAPIVSYEWDFGDAELSTDPAPSHAYLLPGGYNVRLTVIDAAGLEGRDQYYLPVWKDQLKPPFARARVRPGTSGEAPFSPTLVAEFGDPDGIIVRREWSFPDRPSVLDEDPLVTLSRLGTLRAVLTVTDNDGLSSTDFVELRATRNGQLPPEIRSKPSLSARVGEPWLYDEDGRAAATNGPFRWAVGVVVNGARVSAPQGLSIDERTGAVAWTPAPEQAGPQEVALTVTNEAGEAVQRFVVLVQPPTTGCGCRTGPGAVALLAAAWVWRRRRGAR